ncbi:class I SAM-dependent methyltransferase [Bradyrhizobium sp. Pear77]|uniref:class I SAM-dependent methyltransferase n=1 Tax=Bradyrhizobium altum TaxID=1571202 RepID=UPI001E64EFB0|nr:class I SAM-dependent methyltransferase [Bradyrhizobium altum]MCC8952078.1 class I SAM-dependent methyltransferase [Bradyrhizobium altum]
MHDIDKEKILARYASRIGEVGHGAAALGEPKHRQAFFFDILRQVDGLQATDSIVDIGCGYGDLFGFLRSAGWQGAYTGIDINAQLIEEGKRIYPDAELVVVDIQTTPPDRGWDWCFCCQALSSATEAVPFMDHFESMLGIMWGLCRKGLVFNLLSPLVDYTHPVHARPAFADVFRVVTGLTNRFAVRHDYMPYEYAIYAYKENEINKDNFIFAAQQDRFNELTRQWRGTGR